MKIFLWVFEPGNFFYSYCFDTENENTHDKRKLMLIFKNLDFIGIKTESLKENNRA